MLDKPFLNDQKIGDFSSRRIKFDDDVETFFKRNNALTEVYERAKASRMFFVQAKI